MNLIVRTHIVFKGVYDMLIGSVYSILKHDAFKETPVLSYLPSKLNIEFVKNSKNLTCYHHPGWIARSWMQLLMQRTLKMGVNYSRRQFIRTVKTH